MGLENTRFQGTYASIGADGSIRVKTAETTPGAVRRDYELRDGTKGTKWELIYTQISGKITAINFSEGKFGMVLSLCLRDKNDEFVLNLPMQSNFAEDLMKKLPSVVLEDKIVIKPYSFEDEKTKKIRKGCTIYQGGMEPENKVLDFFTKEVDGKKSPANGFPELEKSYKEYDKEDWKVYFIQTRKFLKKYTEDNVIPKIPLDVVGAMGGTDVTGDDIVKIESPDDIVKIESPDDEINVDDAF